MSQGIEKIKYCPAGHSSEDFSRSDHRNFIRFDGICSLCSNEHYIQEFKTWSSGNVNIDKIIQESQINDINNNRLHWISYDNFKNIEHIANGGHGSVYSAKLENGIKWNWNFIKQDWEYYLLGSKVALKEIKDSIFNIVEFLKVMKIANEHKYGSITKYYGISKNPSTQNYIIIMDLFDGLYGNVVDDNVTRQLKIADENQKNTSKSRKQELLELFSHSNKLHPQSCYISRYIHTLHGLYDLLEEIKSGKSSELLKPIEEE
ncbi:11649_t:CDS:2 [Diversispora eburnea]|uniref:11649_t:CDS:1 n=1 Tax=Diversispora eburnea TaxID=1213867 RepID=A0A9N8ZVX4_9GLOM|nr:11649_t:CDS:2 [Diversispora eburnea]